MRTRHVLVGLGIALMLVATAAWARISGLPPTCFV